MATMFDRLFGFDSQEEDKSIGDMLREYTSAVNEDLKGAGDKIEAVKNMPEQMWDAMHPLDKAALVTSVTPLVNTTPVPAILGVAADTRSAIQEPEEFFTKENLALTGASYLPYGRLGKYGEKLGIFAGTKAKDADLPALERAKEMQAAGASREQIWRDTGWFESNDGNWKWEIDDSQASLADPQTLLTSGEVRDVLKHPVLEGQYKKDVMGTDILVTQPRAGATSAEGGYARSWKTDGGMVNPEQITTKPMGMAPEQRVPSILHELQHNVQRREGFARGGTPDDYLQEARDMKVRVANIVKSSNERMKKALDGKAALKKSDPQYQAKYDAYDAEYHKALNEKLQVADVYQRDEMEIAYQMYQDLVGEEEARAVAKRWKLTPAERRERFPEEDMDIPLINQAVEQQGLDEFGDIQKSVNYRGVHTAPLKEEGVKNTLDDMSDVYGDDVYDPRVSPKYYGHTGAGDPMDQRSADLVAAFQGKPDAEVTIYRAVPKGTKEINSGDWVTLNKNYAKSHGDSWVNGGEYDIISKKVKAKDIVTDGNSIHEFGYDPD